MDSAWDAEFERIVLSHLTLLRPGDRLGPDEQLVHLGLTSAKAIELITAIESAYRITFADHELTWSNLATAGGMWRIVQRARPADPPGR